MVAYSNQVKERVLGVETAVLEEHGAVSEPVAVRYGWDINPVCNLYNQAGLPAVPFRTDDWAMVTHKR